MHALPRFLVPKRNPAVEIHHPRALPTRVTLRPRAYHAPRRFAPSTASLVSFNQVRSRDPRPSELDLTEVADHLSVPAVPLAIGHAGPLSTLNRSPVLRASSKLASLQGLSRCRLRLTRSDVLLASRALALLGFASLGLSPSVLRPPGCTLSSAASVQPRPSTAEHAALP